MAIAAAKLGAVSVTAVDTDDLAVKAANENARLNAVSDTISTWQGDLSSVPAGQWDIVVVNILAPVIVTLLQSGALLSYVKTDGKLILSGIIDVQAAEVEEAVHASGGRVIDRLPRGDWVTLVAQPSVL